MFRWLDYTYFGAWFNGKRDAKFPPPDGNSRYELQWIRHAQEIFERIAREWEDMDKKLKPEYCKAKAEFCNAEEEKNEAEDDAKKAEGEYAIHKIPFVHTFMGIWVYRLLILAFMIGEIPLTTIIFRIAGESEVLTWIMASLLCIGLPLAAHFNGILLKHRPFKNKDKGYEGYVIVLNTGVILALIAIGYIRKKFFENPEIGESIGIAMEPLAFAIVFMVINMFIYLIASFASFFSHDIDPKTSEAIWQYKRAKKRLKEEEDDLQEAQERHKKAEERFQTIANLRQTVFEIKQKDIEEYKHRIAGYIEHYRKINLRYRVKYGKPVSSAFKEFEIEIPEALVELDEDCPGLDDQSTDAAAENRNIKSGGNNV